MVINVEKNLIFYTRHGKIIAIFADVDKKIILFLKNSSWVDDLVFNKKIDIYSQSADRK